MLNELETCYIPPGLATEEGSASGTRMGEGLHLALTLLGQSVSSDQVAAQGNQSIVGFRWGCPRRMRIAVIANRAGNAGIPIHTVGIGDPTTENSIPLANGKLLEYDGKVVKTRLQEQPLRQVAERTKAATFSADEIFTLGQAVSRAYRSTWLL